MKIIQHLGKCIQCILVGGGLLQKNDIYSIITIIYLKRYIWSQYGKEHKNGTEDVGVIGKYQFPRILLEHCL